MNGIHQILERIPQRIRSQYRSTERSCEEYLQNQCDRLNCLPGDWKGLDCPDCRNKGIVYLVQDSCIVHRECGCMGIRGDLQRMERSGLKNLVEQYTFDRFVDQEPFQKKLKAGALDFLRNHDRQWFFAGGQVGAGKTHLCTAIAVAFLKKGMGVRYMMWCDDSAKLKSVVNDCEEYERRIQPLKTIPVLYIDDFFKTSMGVRYMMWCDDSAKLKSVVNDCEEYERRIQPLKTIPVLYIDDFFKTSLDDKGSKKMPTQADIRLAFEILNYRYNNNCITILSSEWTVDEILHCDEAVGSRIYQRTKEHCFVIGQDRRKNYRLKRGVCT